MKTKIEKTRQNTQGQSQRNRNLLAALALLTLGLFAAPQRATADQPNPIAENRTAPELTGTRWENTPGHEPIKLAALRGKVVVLQFWTYGCINCRRNLPAYNQWQRELVGENLALIGVHTPETPSEANPARIRQHIRHEGVKYPILIDSDSKNWDRWNQQFWPTIYLIDKRGKIRYRWEGELESDNQRGTRRIAELARQLEKEN